MAGKLYLITLPIGNLKDLTYRAKEQLQNGEVIYAEDTRVFKSLLTDLGIEYKDKTIDSFHDHSKDKIQKIGAQVLSGIDVCIVSDAGSPVISDPAYPLLEWAKENLVEVESVPGVSSVLVALELSLFPSQPFTFWGFLSRTDGEKKESFKKAYLQGGTHIYFESPHRIHETLELLKKFFPDFEVCVARELTKKFQTVVRFKAVDYEESLIQVRGEFVLVVYRKLDNKQNKSVLDDELVLMVEDYFESKAGSKQLAKIFSKITGLPTSEIYHKLKND